MCIHMAHVVLQMGTMDKALCAEIECMVRTGDLADLTPKKIRQELEMKFEVAEGAFSDKKKSIQQWIDAALQKRAQAVECPVHAADADTTLSCVTDPVAETETEQTETETATPNLVSDDHNVETWTDADEPSVGEDEVPRPKDKKKKNKRKEKRERKRERASAERKSKSSKSKPTSLSSHREWQGLNRLMQIHGIHGRAQARQKERTKGIAFLRSCLESNGIPCGIRDLLPSALAKAEQLQELRELQMDDLRWQKSDARYGDLATTTDSRRVKRKCVTLASLNATTEANTDPGQEPQEEEAFGSARKRHRMSHEEDDSDQDYCEE